MAEVAREIDGCHSAGANLPLDAVAIGEASVQRVQGIDHDANLTPADAARQPGVKRQ